MTDLVVTEGQASILAMHCSIVQGGYSTPEIERERILKDAARQDDPQAFIDETVRKFADEIDAAPPPTAEGDGPLVYDPEAEPLGLLDQPQNDDELTLRDLLQSLQQIAAGKEALEQQRTELTAAALPLLKRLGRPAMVLNPVTGTVQVAGVREDETLEVPAESLLAELVKHFEAEGLATTDAEFEAESVWKDVLKPPTVDTKEGGLFKHAVDAGRIPGYVVAKVASFKKKAGYVGFTKPKRHQ